MSLACCLPPCPKSFHPVLVLLLCILLIGVEHKPQTPTMAKWVDIGKDMGLKGSELIEFVRGREQVERDDRAQKMELAKSEKEVFETQLKVKELEYKTAKAPKPESKTKIPGRVPKLPTFQDDKDDLDSYLQRFERYAENQGWPKQSWAINLSALLTGKALYVYSRIPAQDADDYDKLKVALFKQYNLTEDGFRIKFRQSRPDKMESAMQFAVRLENNFDRWVDLAKIGKTFLGLKSLMLREQYINSCGPELSVCLKERTPTDLESMAKLAEQFIEARGTTFGYLTQSDRRITHTNVRKPDSSKSFVSKERPTSTQLLQVRTCFICHKKGHIARDCYHRAKPPFKASSMVVEGESSRQISKETCGCTCHKPGSQETVAFMVTHSLGNCCRDDDHVTLRCGHQLPIMSAACKDHKLSRMPVREGLIGGRRVSVLRDSGCSGVVVRRDLVADDSLTGEERVCVLIDGTIRKVPLARVSIDTPFYKGSVEALCMEHPVYDIILGNVPGLRGPSDPNPDWLSNAPSSVEGPKPPVDEKVDSVVTGAVQTRAQKLVKVDQ